MTVEKLPDDLMLPEDRTCDHHDDHDRATDTPRGTRCGAPATHVILWNDDRRFSLGCDAHLEIAADATIQPRRVVPLPRTP